MSEPELRENDLEERLKTTIKRAQVALLLIGYNRTEALPTILEDLFAGVQWILDLYAVDHSQEIFNPDKQDLKWLERP